MPTQKKTSPAITVHSIARAAGVAVGSVSRALNGHPSVSPQMSELILATAKSLNYSPLRRRRGVVVASAPAGIRPSVIERGASVGLLCFGMEDTLVQLPVVSSAMHGIESAVAREGGTLMFANIPKGDRVPAFLTESRVDGLIVKGPNLGQLPRAIDNVLLAQIQRVPHVWLMGKLPNAQGDHCNFDTEIAGQLAAHHLRDCGHTHVAFLNPKLGHTQFENVKRAFCAAAQSCGARVDVFEPAEPLAPVWPLPAVSSEATVETLLRLWSAQPKRNRATAFAVGADTTAVQMYEVFAALGIRVGRDVGLVSCNDERPLVTGLSPGLTTVDVRSDSIGQAAVARLLWRLKHPDCQDFARILIEPSLVIRDSVQMRS